MIQNANVICGTLTAIESSLESRACICLRSISRGTTSSRLAALIFERVIFSGLCGTSPEDHNGRSDVALNVGGRWKLSKHLNVLFSGGRDIVGNTHAMAYTGLQLLTK
jgi:hypothetical protein